MATMDVERRREAQGRRADGRTVDVARGQRTGMRECGAGVSRNHARRPRLLSRSSALRLSERKLSIFDPTMKEVLYFQAGPLANHVGTHFWNTQESYFTYDDGHDPLVFHDRSFREGLTPEVHSFKSPSYGI